MTELIIVCIGFIISGSVFGIAALIINLFNL